MKKDLTNEEIILMYERLDVLYSNIKENKTYGFDLDVYSFFLRHRYAKTQIYGLRVQAYLCTLLKYKTTPSSEDCGDFKTRESEDVEFKCSFLDKYSRQINVKQIRPWQDLDYYYIFTVDYSNYQDLIYKCYKLTKKQMTDECVLMNAKPTHSTKKNNENNDKIELGFFVNLNSEHFIRWENNYLNKKLDLQLLSDERLAEISTTTQYIDEIEKYKAELERLKQEMKQLKEPQITVIAEEIKEVFIEQPKQRAKFRDFMERYVIIEPDNSLSSEWKFTSGGSKYISPEEHKAMIEERIAEYNKIPSEIFNKHLQSYLKKEISLDYLKSILNWEIKRLTKKRKSKEKQDNDISFYTKQFYDGLITQEELTEILNKKIIKWCNQEKINKVAEIDEDYFEYSKPEEEFKIDNPVY